MSEQNQPIEEVVEGNVAETKEATQTETLKEEISYREIKEDGTIKLDLGKLKEFQTKNTDQDVRENEIISESNNKEKSSSEEEKEESSEEESILEEVSDAEETPVTVKTNDPVIEEKPEATPQRTLPENIENLVKFMEDTGGSIEEYVRLNADYSNVDDTALLKEYYKSTKSHLDNDEISFLIEDNFSYDEDIDDERDIRKKKLTLKEEVAKAKKFLNGMKDEYYKEVKLGSKLSSEQQEAINFYNKYNQEQATTSEVQKKNSTSNLSKVPIMFLTKISKVLILK